MKVKFLNIITPLSDIEKMVNNAMIEELNVRIPATIPIIKRDIEKLLPQLFFATPEYSALINGPLNAHFGIPFGEERLRVNTIIRTIANNIEVSFTKIKKAGNDLAGGITIYILKSNFSDILTLPEASILTVNGYSLPWLEWLLVRGNQVIVTDFTIKFVYGAVGSRSGQAIMVQNPGGVWRVPPQYAGTVKNNWLTRALMNSINILLDIIGSVAQKRIVG